MVRAVDRLATGSIAGTLRGQASGGTPSPLAGALVTAQALDDGGTASVVRSVQAGPDGTSLLDLLPAGGTYDVVGQPVVGAVSYTALASGPIAITEAAPVATDDATFTAAVGVGGVAGGVTPVAGLDDADLVVARQPLDAGGTARAFIVRAAAPTFAAGAEHDLLDLLPAGGYALSLERRTVDAGGPETVVTGAAAAATVTAGATATVDLTVP